MRTTFLSSILNLKDAKNLKKMISEDLMSIEWHPKKLWSFFMSEDEKKEIEPIFTE